MRPARARINCLPPPLVIDVSHVTTSHDALLQGTPRPSADRCGQVSNGRRLAANTTSPLPLPSQLQSSHHWNLPRPSSRPHTYPALPRLRVPARSAGSSNAKLKLDTYSSLAFRLLGSRLQAHLPAHRGRPNSTTPAPPATQPRRNGTRAGTARRLRGILCACR